MRKELYWVEEVTLTGPRVVVNCHVLFVISRFVSAVYFQNVLYVLGGKIFNKTVRFEVVSLLVRITGEATAGTLMKRHRRSAGAASRMEFETNLK